MGAFDQQQVVQLTGATAPLPWLASLRETASARWRESVLPGRKTEAWKYSPITALTALELVWPAESGQVDAEQLLALDAYRVVFVDGRFDSALSCLDGALTVCAFSDADQTQQALIRSHLGSLQQTTDNPFLYLNDSWLQDGALVHVGKGVRLDKPVYVVHASASRVQSAAVPGRTLVVLDEHAEAELVEHFLNLDNHGYLQLQSTEIVLADGARLHHNRLQLEANTTVSVTGVALKLAANAVYEGFMLATGAELKRLDLHVAHEGPGSEYRMNGVYLARDSEHVDVHSCVEHRQPHGTTDELFRGLIDDQAKAVFNGRIHIHPQAQKTQADLSNRNLLLSRKAEVNTKPELEIYADDVRCSHGATVSQVDERSLYYLQSRGISRAEAEVLLGFGFVNEMLSVIRNSVVAEAMRTVIRNWYGRDRRLTRHLA